MDVSKEIEAYDRMRGELELEHMGEWVLFKDGQLVSLYSSFEQAATDAVQKFGRGPYLIRQIGAPPVTLPASVMYGFATHGQR